MISGQEVQEVSFFFLEMNLFLGEGCEQGETDSSAKSWCEVSVGSF